MQQGEVAQQQRRGIGGDAAWEAASAAAAGGPVPAGTGARAAAGQLEQFVIPAQLQQRFVEVPCKLRLVALAALLRARVASAPTSCKMVVFLSTTDSVEYYHSGGGAGGLGQSVWGWRAGGWTGALGLGAAGCGPPGLAGWRGGAWQHVVQQCRPAGDWQQQQPALCMAPHPVVPVPLWLAGPNSSIAPRPEAVCVCVTCPACRPCSVQRVLGASHRGAPAAAARRAHPQAARQHAPGVWAGRVASRAARASCLLLQYAVAFPPCHIAYPT